MQQCRYQITENSLLLVHYPESIFEHKFTFARLIGLATGDLYFLLHGIFAYLLDEAVDIC